MASINTHIPIIALNINGLNSPIKRYVKNKSIIWPSCATPWHMPKEPTSYSMDTCTAVFVPALLTIVRKLKHPECPSTSEWLMKMWCVCTMRYYSVIKKSEIMNSSGKWIELENISSEGSQTQRPLAPSLQIWVHILQELQEVKRDHCQVREVSGQHRGEEQGTSEGMLRVSPKSFCHWLQLKYSHVFFFYVSREQRNFFWPNRFKL